MDCYYLRKHENQRKPIKESETDMQILITNVYVSLTLLIRTLHYIQRLGFEILIFQLFILIYYFIVTKRHEKKYTFIMNNFFMNIFFYHKHANLLLYSHYTTWKNTYTFIMNAFYIMNIFLSWTWSINKWKNDHLFIYWWQIFFESKGVGEREQNTSKK